MSASRRAYVGLPQIQAAFGWASNFGFRQASRDGLPKAAHFLGRAARWIDFGHAPAAARCVLVLDSGKNQRRDQRAHFFKRLDAVLDSGGLSGRALVEQEHEPGPDLLKRRARSSAGP